MKLILLALLGCLLFKFDHGRAAETSASPSLILSTHIASLTAISNSTQGEIQAYACKAIAVIQDFLNEHELDAKTPPEGYHGHYKSLAEKQKALILRIREIGKNLIFCPIEELHSRILMREEVQTLNQQVFLSQEERLLPYFIYTNKSGGDYGGSLGNKLYHRLTKEAVIPFGVSLCTSFSNNNLLPVVNIFESIIRTFGEIRRYLAILTSTNNAFYFGTENTRIAQPVMMDLFSINHPWPAWYQEIEQRLIRESKEINLIETISLLKEGDMRTLNLKKSVIDIKKLDKNRYGFYYRASSSLPYSQAFPSDGSDTKKADTSASYWWIQTSPFVHSFFEDQGDKRGIELRCYHTSSVSPVTQNNDATHYFNILLHGKDYRSKELLKAYSGLLWMMSHSSYFARGQAAITEWLLHALALHNNHSLIFSDAWSPEKGGIQPDQAALSEFDRRLFIKDCIKNQRIQIR